MFICVCVTSDWYSTCVELIGYLVSVSSLLPPSLCFLVIKLRPSELEAETSVPFHLALFDVSVYLGQSLTM